jgi:hypothetical protein
MPRLIPDAGKRGQRGPRTCRQWNHTWRGWADQKPSSRSQFTCRPISHHSSFAAHSYCFLPHHSYSDMYSIMPPFRPSLHALLSEIVSKQAILLECSNALMLQNSDDSNQYSFHTSSSLKLRRFSALARAPNLFSAHFICFCGFRAPMPIVASSCIVHPKEKTSNQCSFPNEQSCINCDAECILDDENRWRCAVTYPYP